MAREELNDIHDALYVLSCAVDDVQRDLADIEKPSAKELRDMLQWIWNVPNLLVPCVCAHNKRYVKFESHQAEGFLSPTNLRT